MDWVRNKVVIVVGGASGIGRAISQALGSYGATVLVADTDRRHSLEVVQSIRQAGGRAQYVSLDVRREESWEQSIGRVREDYSRIDGLVSTMGAYLASDLATVSDEKLRYKLEINLWGICMGLQHCAPVMAEQGSGFIVNIPAIEGDVTCPGAATYGGSVDAIVAATQEAIEKYGPSGVFIACIRPDEAKSAADVAELVLSQLAEHWPVASSGR